MKFGVCAIIKNENLYLREWVEHYINLGFDKIIIYDNNNPSGELPNVVIQDYIDAGIIDVINRRGARGNADTIECGYNLDPQIDAYNECLETYKDELDWIAFFDVDEFLEIRDAKTIQEQFEFMDYDEFDVVYVAWEIYGDNGKMYYEPEPVQKRFPLPVVTESDAYFPKSICKTNKGIRYNEQPHAPDCSSGCSADKVQMFLWGMNYLLPASSYDHMVLKHYFTKSLTEYLYRKLNWWRYDNSDEVLKPFEHAKDLYLMFNGQWTDEHERIFQNFINQYGNK